MLRRSARFLPLVLPVLLACFTPNSHAQTLSVTAPSSFTIHPGDRNVTLPVTIGASSLAGPVSVTLRGLPSGITVAPLTLTPGSSGNLVVSATVFADREQFPTTTIGGPNSATTTVTVVAAAGTTQATANTALTVSLSDPDFAPALDKINLPIVRIDTGGVPVTSKDIDVPGTITITSADGSTSYLPNASDSDNTATFHVHGTTTSVMQKKPYNIKLNTSLDLLSTMGLYCPYNKDPSQSTCDKSKTYILLANYDDKSLLRDWSASALANAIPMGGDYLSSPAGSPSPSKTALMPWAPHSLFVELYLNGQYMGNYQFIEKVNVDSHRVNITELSESDTGAGSDDITGGYLMEIDQHQDESYVFITPQLLPIGLIDPDFSPDPEVPQQTAYISSYVTQAENALAYGDPADHATGWRAYFDDATLVNFYLVNEIMGNTDGGAFFSSDYLYKQQDNPLLYMGPIWDFDISSGNVNNNGANPTTPSWMQVKSPWYLHLFADPTFKAEVAAQFNALKKNGVFDSWLNSINQQAGALQQSQANNFARWPIIGITVWPNAEAAGSYSDEVAYLTTYLKLRIAWLDADLNNKATSSTTLALSSASAVAGTPVTMTASVTAANTPSGTVTFLLNGLSGPTASLGSDGKATVTVNSLQPGNYNVTAVYSGDAQNALSSSAQSALGITGAPAQSTTSIATSSTAIMSGAPVTLTARVIPASGTATPTGSVAFKANGAALGQVPLAADGTATLSTRSLPTGNITVVAVYFGDSSYATSSSPNITVAVAPLIPTFQIAPVSPSLLTYLDSADTTLNVISQNGFSGPIKLACTAGLPTGGSCTFSPSTVNAAPGVNATSALHITLGSTATAHNSSLPAIAGKTAAAFAFALLLWPARSRSRRLLAVLLLVVAAGGTLIGCGSNNNANNPTPTTYSITVQATGGSVSQSTVLKVSFIR